ncbi:hypothetical protein BV20DRAFT_1022127 [Pilatotrama ljubarskyi]|nr:hypothetical protein BV20DRAFT_1022127 [Pilatotrama ljubarskyi]
MLFAHAGLCSRLYRSDASLPWGCAARGRRPHRLTSLCRVLLAFAVCRVARTCLLLCEYYTGTSSSRSCRCYCRPIGAVCAADVVVRSERARRAQIYRRPLA